MAGPKVNGVGWGCRGPKGRIGRIHWVEVWEGALLPLVGAQPPPPPPPPKKKMKMKNEMLSSGEQIESYPSVHSNTYCIVSHGSRSYKSAAVRRCRPISAVRVREGISKTKKGGGGAFRALPLKLMQMVHSETIFDDCGLFVFCFQDFLFGCSLLLLLFYWGGGGGGVYHRSVDVAAEIFWENGYTRCFLIPFSVDCVFVYRIFFVLTF